MASDSFEERLAALEARAALTLRDLPLAALQRKLEQDWQPQASILLGENSITAAMLVDLLVSTAKLADGAVTLAKLADIPQFNIVTTAETRLNVAYGALATAGPSLTVAEAGDYIVEIGCYERSSTAGASALMSYDIGGTAAVDADGVQFDSGVASNGAHVSRAKVKTLAAGTVLTAKYRASAGTGTFSDRWMKLTRIT